jgi:hypothetical protein
MQAFAEHGVPRSLQRPRFFFIFTAPVAGDELRGSEILEAIPKHRNRVSVSYVADIGPRFRYAPFKVWIAKRRVNTAPKLNKIYLSQEHVRKEHEYVKNRVHVSCYDKLHVKCIGVRWFSLWNSAFSADLVKLRFLAEAHASASPFPSTKLKTPASLRIASALLLFRILPVLAECTSHCSHRSSACRVREAAPMWQTCLYLTLIGTATGHRAALSQNEVLADLLSALCGQA